MLALLSALVPTISTVLTRIIPDPEKAAQAQTELVKALQENESAIMSAMADVMKADAQSEGWLTRSARPIVALGFASIYGVTYLSGIADALFGTNMSPVLNTTLNNMPSDLTNMIMILLGGYTFGRTAEKIAATVVKGRK